jgi:hypothetical protein
MIPNIYSQGTSVNAHTAPILGKLSFLQLETPIAIHWESVNPPLFHLPFG